MKTLYFKLISIFFVLGISSFLLSMENTGDETGYYLQLVPVAATREPNRTNNPVSTHTISLVNCPQKLEKSTNIIEDMYCTSNEHGLIFDSTDNKNTSIVVNDALNNIFTTQKPFSIISKNIKADHKKWILFLDENMHISGTITAIQLLEWISRTEKANSPLCFLPKTTDNIIKILQIQRLQNNQSTSLLLIRINLIKENAYEAYKKYMTQNVTANVAWFSAIVEEENTKIKRILTTETMQTLLENTTSLDKEASLDKETPSKKKKTASDRKSSTKRFPRSYKLHYIVGGSILVVGILAALIHRFNLLPGIWQTQHN